MIIENEALWQFEDLYDWYSAIDIRLSKKFATEFYKVLDEIANNPTHHFYIAPNLRRCVFKTFQCAVVYNFNGNIIKVALVVDLRSQPKTNFY